MRTGMEKGEGKKENCILIATQIHPLQPLVLPQALHSDPEFTPVLFSQLLELPLTLLAVSGWSCYQSSA